MKRSILIVDDEFGLADVMSDILIEQGYDVAVAINGRQGLKALAEKPAHLVLLDMMMPIMDGPEMLREMRADPALAQLPVVMMTALPEALPPDDPPLYQAALHKPFSPDLLIATVRKLLAEPDGDGREGSQVA